MRRNETLIKKEACKNQKLYISGFLCLFLIAMTLSAAFIIAENGHAGKNETKNNFQTNRGQTTPTPPPTLISDRCSAYSAPSVPSPLNTYYINASSGNDSNNGLSPSTAWQTIQKANNVAQAGDLFLLRGVFTNQWIYPNANGTSTNKITYREEPGQTAVIDTGLYGGAVFLLNRSHIVVDGLEIRNVGTPFQVSENGGYNWFRNLYIHDSGSSFFITGANNNRLEDSVLVDIGNAETNEGDSLRLINNADDNVVVRNYFGNAGHSAYEDTLTGDSTGYNEDNIVAQNIFDNQEANNVNIGGRSVATLVECNEIKNASQASQYNYSRPGLAIGGDNTIARYNYIYNNKSYGIMLQGNVYAGTQQQFPEDNHIYHNTVVGNGSAGLAFIARDPGDPNGMSYVRDNIIENNIFWNNTGYLVNGNYYDVLGEFYHANNPWAPGFTDGNIFRYNNTSNIGFFAVVRNTGGGGNYVYSTPDAAEMAISSWTNNTQFDPLFTNPSANDYSLQHNSPMIDAGKIISGVAYNGPAPDKGAFEGVGSTLFDFDGDGKADISVYRPSSTGVWYLDQSTNGFTAVTFGGASDIITPADFDGDRKTDVAVFRPSNGIWYLQRSNLGYTTATFGQSGDIPVQADYDGDGKADVAVFRPSNGYWYYIRSSDSGTSSIQLGQSGDKPAVGDFDGDGVSDTAVYRPSTGVWYWINSSDSSLISTTFGASSDIITPADYDGDGKTDIAVFRPSNGTWYGINSGNQQSFATAYGASTDIPVPADYDYDGKADIGVFRPSNGTWYLSRSTQGGLTQSFGQSGDVPIPSTYVR